MATTNPEPETTMKTFLKVLSVLSCVFALLSGDTTAMTVAGATAGSEDEK